MRTLVMCTLAQIHDLLFPKLMSNEIRPAETKNPLEAVA